MKKDYSWLLYLLLLGIALLASCCYNPDKTPSYNIKAKVHNPGRGIKYVLYVQKGLIVGDTTVITTDQGIALIVIDSIIPEDF